jgi:ribosomal-protein-alanine N-acetyltransferase
METLMTTHGFSNETHIITLMREIDEEFAHMRLPANISIRPMTARDLDAVRPLDEQAFPPAWQMNRLSLRHAYQDSNYSTVAIAAGRIVGYQISTSTFSLAHLARLAVAPEAQHQHIGRSLVRNLFMDCLEKGITTLSVNTQTDNVTSLKFYRSLGFQQDGKLIPVYRKDL